MSPEEQQLHDLLEQTLQGELTPVMVAMLADATVHVGRLNGMMYEQVAMIFAEILSHHMPNVAGIELRMYGYGGGPQMRSMPAKASQPAKTEYTEEQRQADEVTRRLLKDFKFDLGTDE